MKQVRETAAGKSISAYVILNKKREHVATVQACYTDGGVCYVDVWNEYKVSKTQTDGPQQKRAGGYGYDKFTNALRGMVIDGVTLNDHCGQDEASQRLLKQYQDHMRKVKPEFRKSSQAHWENKVSKLGMRFANFKRIDDEFWIFDSLYYESGLDKLTLLGYSVIRAI
jgi:hypothetical protein